MKLLRFFLFFLACLPSLLWAASTFEEGKDYKTLKIKDSTLASNTVVEFFNPGCPACFNMESTLQTWLKKPKKGLSFSRVPLAFHEEWLIYSKAYYVAEGLGIEETLLPALFDAIHVKNQPLNTEEDMIRFFADKAVPYKPDQIKAAFRSLSLSAELEKSSQAMIRYQVMEIPSFLVGGKYIVTLSMAKSPRRTLEIIDYLSSKASK